jgi:hypothetical protein
LLAYLLVLLMSLFVGTVHAYSYEPIPITISHTMNEVIFDGRWTFETEWKASSLNTYDYGNNTQIVLRSAHQDDFIYMLLNPINDDTLDRLNDYAIICFDTLNNKSIGTDIDDYCFMSVLEGDSAVYRGGGMLSEMNHLERIPIPDGFIGVSSTSDHNDRYTLVPHPSYEFRIPTDLIGRESVYGFYFLVYDHTTQQSYTYPQNLIVENFVSNPSEWGEMYSPDKSLPEFGWSSISLILSFAAIVFLAKLKHRLT